jgi:1-aminocyclopropane-1-carboxylate deaminase/D-cysteine desulfhydrase-like pyridoxal-dependent ACC family enzyme
MQNQVPLQKIVDPLLEKAGVTLYVFRLDQLHSDIDGNKWYKLKYNLVEARQAGHSTLLSFGGAWSNHIHALARVGSEQGFETVGIIRGEPAYGLTPTLQDAQGWGMQLKFVSRSDYRDKNTEGFLRDLAAQFGNVYILPEGGSNEHAVSGCQEIVRDLDNFIKDYDVLVSPVGTGGTLAGLAKGAAEQSAIRGDRINVLGISMLKGAEYLDGAVEDLLGDQKDAAPYYIDHRFHGGGYAKRSPALLQFIDDFRNRTGIPVEPVYSGKMLWGLYEMIRAGEFVKGTRIVALHTGGMQGARAAKLL